MTAKDYDEKELYALPVNYAQELGANDRYVLAKLVYIQGKARHGINGKLWFYLPLRKARGKAIKSKKYHALAEYFPWISGSALHDIVRRLVEEKYLLIEQHKAIEGDKTLWYHVPEKVCKACKKALVRYFNPAEASAKGLSINCALVLNVIYRDFHIKVTNPEQRLMFNYSALSRDLGIPLSTINSVFIKLQELNYLIPTAASDGKAFALNVSNPCKLKGNGKGRKKVSKLIEVVVMEKEQFEAVQQMLQDNNVREKSTAHAGKMTLRQMLEEMYLVQLEREKIALAHEQKEPVKKKRVRRPVLFPKRKTQTQKLNEWADKEDEQGRKMEEAYHAHLRQEGKKSELAFYEHRYGKQEGLTLRA